MKDGSAILDRWNSGRRALSHPGAGRGRDAAGPRRAPCGPGRRRRSPGRRGRASARCSARAGAIAAPGRSPSSSAWTRRSSATRVRSSRTRRAIARSGAPTSTPRWPPTSSTCSTPTISPPSSSPTAPRTTPTSSSRRSPPAGRSFDDYVAKNREHAEIDPAGLRRPPAARRGRRRRRALVPRLRDRLRTRRCSAFERSAHERIGGRIQTFVLRISRYLRDDVRDPPRRRQQVVRRSPPGRALGHRARRRSARWATMSTTSP